MREYIQKDKDYYILSRSIDNAAKCRITDAEEEYFTVELSRSGRYEVDESVEKGQLYFETIVKEVNGNKVSIWYPINYKYLQRREYTRINIDENVELETDALKYTAKLLDISAGGMKISTKEQLELLKKYEVKINIENKEIKCEFEPIRIEANSEKFISSGRFTELSNYDRITLVQYCFMKQIENSNK